MIARMLTLAGALTGAAGLSQFPEFSQQYTQRLGGAVDELARVVADFDASAAAEGLTRDAALAEMTGTAFVDRRRGDMARTIARHARLEADLAALRAAGPFTRALHPARFGDADLLQATAADFRPALPLTFAGVSFGGIGLVAGALALSVLSTLLRLLAMPFRRRRAPRREPPLHRPAQKAPVAPGKGPQRRVPSITRRA